jgi:hypothetical protein
MIPDAQPRYQKQFAVQFLSRQTTKIRAISTYEISDATADFVHCEETGEKSLDTYSVLIGEDGYMPQEYHNVDGLHLNEALQLAGIYHTHGYS